MTTQWNNPAAAAHKPAYIPRARSASEFASANQPLAAARHTGSNPRFHEANEQPSPGGSSFTATDPYSPTVNNGYVADYSVSEVSSVTGSVGSFPIGRQPLAVQRMKASRYNNESGDSGNYSSQKAGGYVSSVTSYADTDVESLASDTRRSRPANSVAFPAGDDRFRGELYQPRPAPRTMIVERQVRTMYGEKHPSQLSKDELPSLSSGDELESATSASEISTPSFADAPRIRPRASLRRQKMSEANSVFTSDDELSTTSNAARSKSLPRSILKNNSTDISDAESLAKSSNFSRAGSRRSVRFEHRDKAKDLAKKVTDYSVIDSEDSSQKKKGKVSDPFALIAPVGIKPARNDPKRSSGRSTGSRGSQRGKKARSSSTDRSRQKQSNGSASRSRSVSPGRGKQSPSAERKKPSDQSNGHVKPTAEYNAAVRGGDVRIEMPPPANKQSMMGEMLSQPRPEDNGSKTDVQKVCKWCLIIGVPLVILIVVIAVVVSIVGR